MMCFKSSYVIFILLEWDFVALRKKKKILLKSQQGKIQEIEPTWKDGKSKEASLSLVLSVQKSEMK